MTDTTTPNLISALGDTDQGAAALSPTPAIAPVPSTVAEVSTAPSEASKRAKRTLVQGAVITAVVAIAGVVVQATTTLTGSSVFHAATWEAVGGTAVVSVLHAVSSYVAAKVSPPQ